MAVLQTCRPACVEISSRRRVVMPDETIPRGGIAIGDLVVNDVCRDWGIGIYTDFQDK